MRSILQVFLLNAVLLFGFGTTLFAQLGGWSNTVPITINENRGETGTDYVMFIDINTQTYVSSGTMLANGNDIRFAADCNGSQLIPYWIESGMNTTSTRIWLRLPQLNANTANDIILFTGNPAAAAGSNQAAVFPKTFVSSGNVAMTVGDSIFDWFEIQAADTLFINGNNADILKVTAGKIIVNGVIDGNGEGFNGGVPNQNGFGPGGGTGFIAPPSAGGAGGGAYGGDGGDGGYDPGDTYGFGGTAYGTISGLTIEPGSGGAGTRPLSGTSTGGNGANGGAGIYLKGFQISAANATVNVNGNSALFDNNTNKGGGGGAGGGILLEAEALLINTIALNANGGNGGSGAGIADGGGGGGGGRVKLQYYNTPASTITGIGTSVLGGIGGCCGDQANGEDGIDGTVSAVNPPGAFSSSVGPIGNNFTLSIISGNDTVCRNSSGQTLETYQANVIPGFNYTWQVASGGTIVSGQGTNTITINWTSSGTHNLIVADNSGTCTVTDTLAVRVAITSTASAFSISDACAGETAFFTLPTAAFNPSYSYLWDFGDSTTSNVFEPTHIFVDPRVYAVKLTITNQFGCDGSITSPHTVPAKPTPNFTFTTPTCPSGNVTFTNTSTNATSYFWDFGDGANSTATNPVHAYTTAGTYTVTLTAMASADCDATTTKSVTISANPVPNFTVNGAALACTNKDEDYTSTISAGNSITWSVSGGGVVFGGQGTNTANVNWTTAGTYFVKVTATSPDGCSTSDSLQVTVSDVINVAVPTNTNACAGEVTQFNANKPATGGPYTFLWNFGDGATSTDENPTHIFNPAGTYVVTLAITSPGNCIGTSTTNVVVPAKPVADFVASAACPGADVTFTNNSINATTYEWDFGDGATSTLANPTHPYTVAGTYTVTLRAISTANCDDITTRSVTVSPRPTVDFNATSACPDSLVSFTNLSTIPSGTITTYAWNFGDGNTSAATNPTHAYAAPGTYLVTLIATSNNGCQDSVKHNVTVYDSPTANFAANDVCEGQTVIFTNTSNIPTGTLSYNWAFGDGSTSTDINPTHLYLAAGAYSVTLTATSNNGCIDTISKTVTVNATPVAAFTASATTICFGDTITFTNGSTTGTNVVYNWDFGDGNFSGFVTDTQYVYAAAGNYTVTLEAVDTITFCGTTATLNITVNEEPVVDFTFADVCDGTPVSFTNTSTIPTGTLSYVWDFGDGATSTNINPSHLYAAPGAYNVLLTATSNNGCVDTLTQTVTVSPEPVADFALSNTTACDRDTVFMTNNSTVVGSDIVYTWTFGDGNSSNDVSPAYVYAAPGSYSIVLTVTDTLTGCSDMASDTVTIFHRAVPAFTTADVCLGSAASFTNSTTIGVGTVSYFWDFGDSTYSTDINPTHVYDSIGIKTITLVVTTDNGCTDTVSHTLIVNPLPEADFSVGPTCFGNPTDFTNLTTIAFGTTTYLWNFGDGVTDTASNPSHTYSVLGNYTVTLTSTSNAGCVDVASQVITVHPNPTADFIAANVCEDDSVLFDNNSTVPYGTLTSFWEFGDGFTSINENPTYAYTGFGTFAVTLISTSNNGCADTLTKNVTVYPKPTVAFDVEDVCIGDIVEFTNLSAVPNNGTIADIKWFFGDGAVSLETSPDHLYASPGIYQPFVVITSTEGCVDTLVKNLVVHELPPAAIQALGPLAFCDGGSVDLSAPANQAGYEWSTGETTQTITVTTSGVYTVTVTSIFNCTNVDSIEVIVWPLPVANAGNDTTISKGYSAQLNGSGGNDYEWTPMESLSNASIANPIATPLETTTYTLLVTDTNGCQDTDDVTVFVNEDYLVEATNTLTPNGDGKNDFWYIINIETYPDVEVLIFDRWGTEVYASKAYNNDWDGTYKDNKLPEGTYYYVIRFEGSDRLYKGAVNILR